MAAQNIKGMKLTTSMKRCVSIHMVSEWKMLGRILLDPIGGSDEVDAVLDGIAVNHHHESIQECCYDMLSAWQKRMPDDATLGRLMGALQGMGHTSLAQKLEKTVLEQLQSGQVPDDHADATSPSVAAVPAAMPASRDIRSEPIALKHRIYIEENLGTSWDTLGQALGLGKGLLSSIEEEQSNLKNRCKKVLTLWEKKKRRTVGELEAALLKIEDGAAAEELLEL